MVMFSTIRWIISFFVGMSSSSHIQIEIPYQMNDNQTIKLASLFEYKNRIKLSIMHHMSLSENNFSQQNVFEKGEYEVDLSKPSFDYHINNLQCICSHLESFDHEGKNKKKGELFRFDATHACTNENLHTIFLSFLEATASAEFYLNIDQFKNLFKENTEVSEVIVGINDGIGKKWTYESGIDWNQPISLQHHTKPGLDMPLSNVELLNKNTDHLSRNTIYDFSLDWIDFRENKIVLNIVWKAYDKNTATDHLPYANGHVMFSADHNTAYISGIFINTNQMITGTALVSHTSEAHQDILKMSEKNIDLSYNLIF